MAGDRRGHPRRRGPPGKLKAAGRAWALSRLGRADSREPVRLDADLIHQFEILGAPIAPGALPAAPAASEGFEVMPVNWPAVTAFLGCETQWRCAAGLAGLIWLGLDYGAVDVVMRRCGLADEVFTDIQLIEQAALDVFSEDMS
ncbi:DUF1799 domain-containing protein [Ruixingdingia sedimenti]|uniref:DUF1799 domain-containing protein n=1 Tax=Ruixingdingia sedimenti TaxID=3073604 RepID=A0ABU1FEU2_9RHOB|nr:DUF1799 domain-containing protein [Xinfangfangia sp. LG-4]MDR5655429.1 DUF1799 domain-containing protein [Xinfangfangia sp. LG-4]